jgi:hypothetical protein
MDALFELFAIYDGPLPRLPPRGESREMAEARLSRLLLALRLRRNPAECKEEYEKAGWEEAKYLRAKLHPPPAALYNGGKGDSRP